MTRDELEQAFQTYFEEMKKCAEAECYWALLHLVVVMPDICASLEHEEGDTTGETGRCYEDWCRRYWSSAAISPERRWKIRCALLHQGRTVLKDGDTVSYIRPAPPGSRIHEYVDSHEGNTTLEVDKLAAEVKTGIRTWFDDLQKSENRKQLFNVERYLPWLAREKPKEHPPDLLPPGSSTRGITTSST